MQPNILGTAPLTFAEAILYFHILAIFLNKWLITELQENKIIKYEKTNARLLRVLTLPNS